MKKIFAFSFLFFLLSFQQTKAQVAVHKLITVGYVYQNQSFGEVGGKLLFLNNDDFIFRLGASALLGSANSEFAILPKIQTDFLLNFERNVDIEHSYYFLAGAEATTKYIAPKIGITVFGLLDFTGGYAFSLDKKGINGKELKGFNLNITLNLPLPMLHDMAK